MTPKRTAARKDAFDYSPFENRAKLLADLIFEEAMKMAKVLAPERPIGTEELEPHEQWMMLEGVAAELSVQYWDRPDAIRALYKLRQRFAPALASPYLLDAAAFVERQQRIAPDVSITPENKEFERQSKRLGVA